MLNLYTLGDDPVVAFAGEELARYLNESAAARLPSAIAPRMTPIRAGFGSVWMPSARFFLLHKAITSWMMLSSCALWALISFFCREPILAVFCLPSTLHLRAWAAAG